MSSPEQDPSQKTEQPTQRAKEKAREKGRIPQSREINHFMMFISLALLLWMGHHITRPLFYTLARWFGSLHHPFQQGSDLLEKIYVLVLGVASSFLIALLVLLGTSLFASALQTTFTFSLKNIKPQLNRLSPASGWKRIFSTRSLMEAFKSLVKMILIAVVSAQLFSWLSPSLQGLSGINVGKILPYTQEMMAWALLWIIFLIGMLAVADYAYQWFQHIKKLKMSRQEIKDEIKEQEGDPLLRQRQRQRRRAFLNNPAPLKRAVPESTVVITNPIHYAVALKWDEKTMKAPLVTAKGSGARALYIRTLAKTNFIPLIENPPLARILHTHLDVGQEIQPQHYRAVATIIRYIFQVDAQKSL